MGMQATAFRADVEEITVSDYPGQADLIRRFCFEMPEMSRSAADSHFDLRMTPDATPLIQLGFALTNVLRLPATNDTKALLQRKAMVDGLLASGERIAAHRVKAGKRSRDSLCFILLRGADGYLVVEQIFKTANKSERLAGIRVYRRIGAVDG